MKAEEAGVPQGAASGATPTPKGPELLFHNPFSDSTGYLTDSATTQPPVHSRVDARTRRDPRNRKRHARTRPASRLDEIDVVVRELKLLARSRGTSLD